jgi:hypothetical protein
VTKPRKYGQKHQTNRYLGCCGAPTTQPSLDGKYLLCDGQSFMTGIQALVRLPLERRRRDERNGRNTGIFTPGDQGSPLGTYDIELECAVVSWLRRTAPPP